MSMPLYEGHLQAAGLRFAAVVARFHGPITDQLLAGAVSVWQRHGASEEDITIVRVPGAFELPWAANLLASQKRFDAIVTLGVVAKGATSHYDWICRSAVDSIAQIGKEHQIPVLLGLLTVETLEQAWERAGTKHGNKGSEVASAAIEMANLHKSLDPAVR